MVALSSMNTSLVINLEIIDEVCEGWYMENKTWRWVGRRQTRTSLGGFDGLCRWVEWDKVAFFFHQGGIWWTVHSLIDHGFHYLGISWKETESNFWLFVEMKRAASGNFRRIHSQWMIHHDSKTLSKIQMTQGLNTALWLCLSREAWRRQIFWRRLWPSW